MELSAKWNHLLRLVQLISHRTDSVEPGSHALSLALERNCSILYAVMSSLNLFTNIYEDYIHIVNALCHIIL